MQSFTIFPTTSGDWAKLVKVEITFLECLGSLHFATKSTCIFSRIPLIWPQYNLNLVCSVSHGMISPIAYLTAVWKSFEISSFLSIIWSYISATSSKLSLALHRSLKRLNRCYKTSDTFMLASSIFSRHLQSFSGSVMFAMHSFYESVIMPRFLSSNASVFYYSASSSTPCVPVNNSLGPFRYSKDRNYSSTNFLILF